MAVIDDRPGPYFDACASLTFSPDSAHYAYHAQRGGKDFIVYDGQIQAAHDDVSPPAFSPDSKHLAYSVRDGVQTRLVVDKTISQEVFDGLSRDKKPIFDSPTHLHTLAFRGTEVFRLEIDLPEEK